MNNGKNQKREWVYTVIAIAVIVLAVYGVGALIGIHVSCCA